jgi:hypothetical protein
MLRLQGQSNETNRTFHSPVECRSNAYDCPAGYTITARGHQMFMFSWGSIATPWSGVLLEKLTGSQLVKKFPTFYWTRRFITAFTSASHIALSLVLGQTNAIKKLRIACLNRNVRYWNVWSFCCRKCTALLQYTLRHKAPGCWRSLAGQLLHILRERASEWGWLLLKQM